MIAAEIWGVFGGVANFLHDGLQRVIDQTLARFGIQNEEGVPA